MPIRTQRHPGASTRVKTSSRHPPASNSSPPAITILQLNCNGLKSHLAEILQRADELAVDIVCLQETNLAPTINTPKCQGWNVARLDRTVGRLGAIPATATSNHGGVLTLVRERFCISSSVISTVTSAHDILNTTVHLDNKRKLHFTNMYLANVRHSEGDSRIQDFNPELLPHHHTSFILGDINEHHPSWDTSVPPTPTGNLIHQWAVVNNYICANNPNTPTRIDPATGKGTSPDIFLHHASWEGKVEWKVLDYSWGSDHLPTIIKVQMDRLPGQQASSSKWRYKKADWDLFRTVISAKVTRWNKKPTSNVETLCKRLTKGILAGAVAAIPKGSGRISPKSWWNSSLDVAASARNRATKNWNLDPTNENLKITMRESQRFLQDQIS
jgi:hypothetical protein